MTTKFLVAHSVIALALGVCSGACAAESEKPKNSVSIRFEGRIVDSGCELSTNQEGGTVHLGTYPTQYFRNYQAHTETDAVPFELVIKKCRLIEREPISGNGKLAIPIETVKVTFTDIGGSGGTSYTDGILSIGRNNEAHAENIGVRVRYKKTGSGFENVFDHGASSAISVSDMQYKVKMENGKPTYRLPLQANMVATGKGPVTSGSVRARMAVTLNYE